MAIFNAEQRKLLRLIIDKSAQHGFRTFIVGGVIRDIFLSQVPEDRDLDLVVEGNAIEFARGCQKELGGKLKEFPAFFTAKLVQPEGFRQVDEVDFASAREEIYRAPGRLPEVKISSIEKDLKRRDFSINAMAVETSELVSWDEKGLELDRLKAAAIDYFGGLKDIEDRLVRVLHDKSFIDDPTRIFRAIRYAGRIGGKIEAKTLRLLQGALESDCMTTVTAARKLNELKKILAEKEFERILGLMSELRILYCFPIFPEDDLERVCGLLKKGLESVSAASGVFFDLALRIFYFVWRSQGRADEVFSAFGFSENQLKKLAFETSLDIDLSSKQTSQRLSAAGVEFQKLLRE